MLARLFNVDDSGHGGASDFYFRVKDVARNSCCVLRKKAFSSPTEICANTNEDVHVVRDLVLVDESVQKRRSSSQNQKQECLITFIHSAHCTPGSRPAMVCMS
ncbi:unnamed protein product [Amoebophrya sp. A120]|nr:unnamed protein product [Amoebophrya sp. A120]|eukprot:GSA120T00006384001.1